MTRDFKFTIKGKPQGKARARTFYDGKSGKMRSITPEQTKSYEDLIRWSYKEQGGEYLGKAVMMVFINAYYPIPKSWSKRKRSEALMHFIRPTTKPDCDNIIKVVLDALNGVAYADDSQVVSVSAEKQYSEDERVDVSIIWAGGEENV